MKSKRGKIFVITGPSGAGKTEIARKILEDKSLNIIRVITCTTRKPRQGEENGRDYFFLNEAEFLENIRKGKMFEYAKVYGHYSGSRIRDVEELLKTGKNILFTVDVQGAIRIKQLNPNCITIFIKAENIEELKKRLTSRSTDSAESINKRVQTALEELKLLEKFDYSIINRHGRINDAVKEIVNIVKQQRYSIP